MSDNAIAVIQDVTDIDTTVEKLTNSITDLHEFIEEVKSQVKEFVDQLRTEEIKIYTSIARYRNIILRMQLTLAENELTLQKNINSTTKIVKLHYRNRKEGSVGEETTYSASISQQSRCQHCIVEPSTSDNQTHIDDDDIKKIFSEFRQQLLPYKKKLAKLDHEFRLCRERTNPEYMFTFDNKEVGTQTESCACSKVKVTRSTSTEKYSSMSSSSSNTSKTSKDDKKTKNKSKDSKENKTYNEKKPSQDKNNKKEHTITQRHNKHNQKETSKYKGNQELVLSMGSIAGNKDKHSTKDSSTQNDTNSQNECQSNEKKFTKSKEKKQSSHVGVFKDTIEHEKRDGRESPELTDIQRAETSQEVSQKKSKESNHSKTSKTSKNHKEHSQIHSLDNSNKQKKDTSDNISQKELKDPKDYKQSDRLDASKDCESHRHYSRKGSPNLKEIQKKGSSHKFSQKEPYKPNDNNELNHLDTTKLSKSNNLTDSQKKDSSHKMAHQDASILKDNKQSNHLETSKSPELHENQNCNGCPNRTDIQKKDDAHEADKKEPNKLNNKNKDSNNLGASKGSDYYNNHSRKQSSKLPDSEKKGTSHIEANKPNDNKESTHGKETSRTSERYNNHIHKMSSKFKDTQKDEVSLKQTQMVPAKPIDKKQITNLNVSKDSKKQEKHVLSESCTFTNKQKEVTSLMETQKYPSNSMDNEEFTHISKNSHQQNNLNESSKLTDCQYDTSKNIETELAKSVSNKSTNLDILNSIEPGDCFIHEIIKQENYGESIRNFNDSDIDSDSTLILEEKYTVPLTEFPESESVDIKPNLLPFKCESIQVSHSSSDQNTTDNTRTLQSHNDPKLTTKVPVVLLENIKLTDAKYKSKEPENNLKSLESIKISNNDKNKLAKVPIVRLQYQDFIRKYKERLAEDYNINMPTSTSIKNFVPENNSQSKKQTETNNTSNENSANNTTSQLKSTVVKSNNSRRKRRRSGRSRNRACKKLKSDNTISSIQPQSTITNQPQSSITKQLQSTITNQSQSTITKQLQSTSTNQPQSTITNQLQSTIAPGLITYIPVINLDAIALHYQPHGNFSNRHQVLDSIDQTDLVSYLPPRDLLEPVKSTYKLNVNDITQASTTSHQLPVNPIYKFIADDDTKKKMNNTTFKYHAVNEKLSNLPNVRDNRFIFNDEVTSIRAVKNKPIQNNIIETFNPDQKAKALAFDKEIERVCIPRVFDKSEATSSNKQPSVINPQVKCTNKNVVSREPRAYSKGFYREFEDGSDGYVKPYEAIYTPSNLDHYKKKDGNIYSNAL